MKRLLGLLLILCILTGCAQAEPEPQWWASYVHAEALSRYGVTGKGVLVAVLDSGVALHPDLEQVDIQGERQDAVGHGTFVTGLLAALMPEATYLSIRITDTATEISVDRIIEGLEYAISQSPDVAVLSLGMDEDVPELRNAVERLADMGCLIFAAVGNDGTDTLYYPAAYEPVLGVGACNLAFAPSETSQYNESVYVLAPGVKMTGPWPDGGYRTLKGTSYAVPVAAAMGVAAKSCNPETTGADFAALLQTSTTDICETGYDTSSGWGIINFEKFCSQIF